jgi:3-oxoacyl-[acyl-carrier protein] reductase
LSGSDAGHGGRSFVADGERHPAADRRPTLEPRFAGRTALVTGGSSGIGLAAAERLAAEGAAVVIVARDGARLEAARQQVLASADGTHVTAFAADVTDASAMEEAARVASGLGGRLDVLVAAAGIDGKGRDALELDAETFAHVLDVNLRGLFLASRAAARHMAADGRGGAMVLVASVNGLEAERHFADYNASKGGAVMLARSLAVDLADRGIRVNAVCPGYVRTPMTEAYLRDPATLSTILEAIPLRRVAEPREVASVICFLASDEASYITGSAVVVDGGRTA